MSPRPAIAPAWLRRNVRGEYRAVLQLVAYHSDVALHVLIISRDGVYMPAPRQEKCNVQSFTVKGHSSTSLIKCGM